MANALSLDLRCRVVAAVMSGASCRQTASRFGVSASSAIRCVAQVRETGDVAPKPRGGPRRRSRIEPHGDLIVVATILLCYFDLRYDNMRLQAVFLGTNVIGAIGSIAAGFPFYGYGYFLAAMVTALYGLWLVYRRVGKLPYITFVTNNPSLRSNADALI